MSALFAATLVLGSLQPALQPPRCVGSTCRPADSLYDLGAEDVTGSLVNFAQWRGRVALVVDSASE